jgi:hypothetical protein
MIPLSYIFAGDTCPRVSQLLSRSQNLQYLDGFDGQIQARIRRISAADTLICRRCSQNATQSLCNPTYPAASTPRQLTVISLVPGSHFRCRITLYRHFNCCRACHSSSDDSGLLVRLAPPYATLQSISACRTHLPLEQYARCDATLADLDICIKCLDDRLNTRGSA